MRGKEGRVDVEEEEKEDGEEAEEISGTLAGERKI